ncbi:MAG TPA: hypothetical protein VGQ71_09910 [Terriglobales bacterium]|nr:hypothetical protein [Terriglobales bacterium]
MKRISGLIVIVALVAAMAVAGNPAKKQTKVSGTLVDVACATEQLQKQKPDFAQKHDKECMTMADCAKNGYALLTADNKVLKFDAEGNEQARKLIAETKKEEDFKATVTGTVQGDTIEVATLTLD